MEIEAWAGQSFQSWTHPDMITSWVKTSSTHIIYHAHPSLKLWKFMPIIGSIPVLNHLELALMAWVQKLCSLPQFEIPTSLSPQPSNPPLLYQACKASIHEQPPPKKMCIRSKHESNKWESADLKLGMIIRISTITIGVSKAGKEIPKTHLSQGWIRVVNTRASVRTRQ